MSGENLTSRNNGRLSRWYDGPTLLQVLGMPRIQYSQKLHSACNPSDDIVPPDRALDAALRIPISNVFRGQTSGPSGLGISGRIESGIVQVGETLAVLPGDESGIVRSMSLFPFHCVVIQYGL